MHTRRLGAAAASSLALSALVGFAAAPHGPVVEFVLVQPGAERTAREAASSFGGVKAISRPSRDSTMGFAFPAEVAEVVTRGGASVKKGDVLLRARDDEATAQRDLQKLVADSDLDIQRAQVALDQAQVEYTAQVDLQKQGGGQKVELDRARTTLDARKVELEIAKLNRDQQVLTLKFRQAQLERFTLLAPFDGRVDLVQADVGEVKKDSEPVIRVVNTNPLWIDVNAPTLETLAVTVGAPAWVLMDLPGEPKVNVGKVVELAADADSASGTRRVRVELPNPEDWPSGLNAWVRLTRPTGDWAGRIVRGEGGAGLQPVGSATAALEDSREVAPRMARAEGSR
jgi:RND family efflux transporter MFP subunit